MTDQTGRVVEVPDGPRRIVSLCPSTTETLFALGVGERVVGRTDYCTRPAGVDAVSSVGGTKTARFERVARLEPDLIVGVKEENDRDQILALAERWPVFLLDPVDVDSAVAGVSLLGDLVGHAFEGRALAARIEAAFASIPRVTDAPDVLYLIWRKPWMAAGSGTYIDDVLRRVGFGNAASGDDGRYPRFDDGRIRALDPDLLLASSEPFPFGPDHVAELAGLVGGDEGRVLLVDGEVFSWHGVRMLDAARELERIADRVAAAGSGG